MKKFNNTALNLEILAEEAAEVIQIKSKIIRFGIDDFHQKNRIPNREKLEEEIGHLLKMVDILIFNGTISKDGVEKGRSDKVIRLNKWYRPIPAE